jgi:hypothetical protein
VTLPVDAVVPVHAKDLPLLPWCVEGIRQNLPVARVLVVAGHTCREAAQRVGAVFVDEDTVVPGLTARSYDAGWGWYFQQILKLAIADRIESDYYVVVDADAVFLRPVDLFNAAGRPLYATGIEYHAPYFGVFRELLGFEAHREHSFIAHHMVFNRRLVQEMRARFSPEKPWYANVVRYRLPRAPWDCKQQFSEYETYGHYLKAVHPEELHVRPLRWTNVPLAPSPELLRRLRRRFDFCAFHEHMAAAKGSLCARARTRLKFEARLLTGRADYGRLTTRG